MTALITIGIVLSSIFCHLGIGWFLAKRDLPNAWIRARRNWFDDRSRRGSVKAQMICLTLFWPILAPIRFFSTHLDAVVVRYDPAELQRQLKERAQYIAKLERELGIGRNT